jgi:hypothetical protein
LWLVVEVVEDLTQEEVQVVIEHLVTVLVHYKAQHKN